MKVYSNGPGHRTKMATMPIYGKNLKNLLLRKVNDLESWYAASGDLESWYAASSITKFIQDDSGLTLTYYTARSNLVPYAFVKQWIFFQKLL